MKKALSIIPRHWREAGAVLLIAAAALFAWPPAQAQINLAGGGGVSVTSGSGAPAAAPRAVGDLYVDTAADNVYRAYGTASSADWAFESGRTYQAVEATGGATQLSLTGIPDLVDGGEYEIFGTVIQDGTGSPTFSVLVNNSTDAADYVANGVQTSSAAHANTTTRPTSNAGASTASGQISVFYFRVTVEGTRLAARGVNYREITGYSETWSWSFDDGTAPARLDLLSSVASKIAAGSNVAVRRIH